MKRISPILSALLVLLAVAAPLRAAVADITGPQLVQAGFSSGNITSDATAGVVAWTNPGNAATLESSSLYTTASLTAANTTTQYLKFLGPNFRDAIPNDATITGWEVLVYGRADTGTITVTECMMVKGGAIVGTSQSNSETFGTTSGGTAGKDLVIGGPTNLFNTTWTVAEANAPDTGFVIRFTGSGVTQTASIDVCVIRCYYTTPTAEVVITTSDISALMAPAYVRMDVTASKFGGFKPQHCRMRWDCGGTLADGQTFTDPDGRGARDAETDVLGFSRGALVDRSGTWTVYIDLPNGTTVSATKAITVAADTRTPIYVASTGNDANDGSTPALAVKTETRVEALAAGAGSYKIILASGDTTPAANWVSLALTGKSNILIDGDGASYGHGAGANHKIEFTSTCVNLNTCTDVVIRNLDLECEAANETGRFTLTSCTRVAIGGCRNVGTRKTASSNGHFILTNVTSTDLYVYDCDSTNDAACANYTVASTLGTYRTILAVHGIGNATDNSIIRIGCSPHDYGGLTVMWCDLPLMEVDNPLRLYSPWTYVSENVTSGGEAFLGWHHATATLGGFAYTVAEANKFSGGLVTGNRNPYSSFRCNVIGDNGTQALRFDGRITESSPKVDCSVLFNTFLLSASVEGVDINTLAHVGAGEVQVKGNLVAVANKATYEAAASTWVIQDRTQAASNGIAAVGGNVFPAFTSTAKKWWRKTPTNDEVTFANYQATYTGGATDVQADEVYVTLAAAPYRPAEAVTLAAGIPQQGVFVDYHGTALDLNAASWSAGAAQPAAAAGSSASPASLLQSFGFGIGFLLDLGEPDNHRRDRIAPRGTGEQRRKRSTQPRRRVARRTVGGLRRSRIRQLTEVTP